MCWSQVFLFNSVQNYNLLWLLLHWCFWKVLWELLLCSVLWVDMGWLWIWWLFMCQIVISSIPTYCVWIFWRKKKRKILLFHRSGYCEWIKPIFQLCFSVTCGSNASTISQNHSFRCSSDVIIWFHDVINWFREQMLCFYTSIVCIYVTVMTCVKMLNQKHIKRKRHQSISLFLRRLIINTIACIMISHIIHVFLPSLTGMFWKQNNNIAIAYSH